LRGIARNVAQETVTVARAAELTGLSRKAIQRRIDRWRVAPDAPGGLPAILEEGRRRVAISDLQRLGLLKGEPPEPEPAERGVDETIAQLERSVRETATAVVQLRRELAAERAAR
jgi:hypothetical protein